jgi:glycosyltransferase involved in cell wall biosynthesis
MKVTSPTACGVGPLVTIAIPTFSRLAYLQEAVASAQAQTYALLEIFVSDDGSSREISEWCAGVCRVDSRVRYQHTPQRLGLSGNFNALADAAQGQYILFMGDDDRLLPECVGELAMALRLQTRVVFANHFLIDSRGRRLEAETRDHARRYHRENLAPGALPNPQRVVWQNAVPMTTSLISTADARRLRFREDLNTPDIEFFARLAAEAAEFVFVPDYLAEYRVHSNSATTAGLRSENLVKYLAPLPVPQDVEVFKRQFMELLLVNAASRCLEQGDAARAREFLGNEYYPHPRWRRASGIVQTLCSALPPVLGAPLYRAIAGLKRTLRR